MIIGQHSELEQETIKFNKAVELFFGMNPAKRYWMLLALYFAKIHHLKIVDNYDGNDFVMATLSSDLIDDSMLDKWKAKGIYSRSVVALVPDGQQELVNKVYDFVNDWEEEDIVSRFFSTTMEPVSLVEVAETLIGLSDAWYKEFSDKAFDIIIRKAINDAVYYSIFSQPKEIAELVIKLLDAKSGSVYEPYSGLCSIGALLNPNCNYVSQDCTDVCFLGELNLLINDKTNFVCEKGDSVSDWKGGDGYDYIISVPDQDNICEEYGTSERDFFFRSAFNAKYKAIGIYNEHMCFDGYTPKWTNKISELIKMDIIESVILLPNNISGTNTDIVVFVVNKKKTFKGQILFVDATDLYIEVSNRRVLKAEAVYQRCLQRTDNTALISNAEILGELCNLHPIYYTRRVALTIPAGMKSVSLGNILSKAESVRADIGKIYKNFEGFSNLDFIRSGGIVDSSYLNEVKAGGLLRRRIVSEDCLICGLHTKFEVRYLETKGEEVIVHPAYMVFVVDKTAIDLLLLLSELSKSYFLQQLERYRRSSGYISISEDDFLKLSILMPLSQDELISQITDFATKRVTETLMPVFLEQKKLYEKGLEDFVNNQRERKHAVAQVLNEIVPSLDNVVSFISDNESVSKDSVVSKRFGTTLSQKLSLLQEKIDKVVLMVDKFTALEKFGEPEVIDLCPFLKDYSRSKLDSERYISSFRNVRYKDVSPKVLIAKDDFTQMLDNLFTNASKHGFSNPNRKDYEVRLSIELDMLQKPCVVIKVANNGDAVSKSISIDRLFVWGEGHGSGIGCWQVKEIAEHYGGSVTYNEYPDDMEGFVCEFRIVLPLIEE